MNAFINITATKGRINLLMTCADIGDDLLIILNSIEYAHIGAVSTSLCLKKNISKVSLITVPGHKESDLATRIATSITQKTGKTTCAICGIHIPNISKNEIKITLDLTQELIDKLSTKLLNKI